MDEWGRVSIAPDIRGDARRAKAQIMRDAKKILLGLDGLDRPW